MSTQTADLLNAEQVQTIADAVAEFGFFGTSGDMEYAERSRARFVRFLSDREQYFGGSFEYCNRFDGIRLHVSLNPSRTSVRYANLSLDGAWAPYTEEQVQAANERMAAVLFERTDIMNTQTADLLNAEQVQTIADTMAEFGFFGTSGDMEYAERSRAAFVRFLSDPEQYSGRLFEYCNRFDGIRIHVSLNPSRTSVRYANLSLDGAWAPYTEEEVQAANERMAAVL